MTAKKSDTTTLTDDNAPEGLAISDKEIVAARRDGAKDAVKDQAKDSYKALTDGMLPGDPTDMRWHGSEESQQWAYYLDLGVKEFEEKISGRDSPVSDEKVYGLLALERNGQNRTPYVKAMMKRLDLKADELPGGGPAYTNDLTAITDL